MSGIEIRELVHGYPLASAGRGAAVDVLDSLTLSVVEGEFVAFVGPTGCGKTTLLRILAGLIEPTGGKIRRARGAVGMVFQTPALLPWLSVAANIALPLRIAPAAARNGHDRVGGLLRLAGLEPFARAYPHQLSVGMQQKVSLCRALIRRPDLLLLDEPFSALDALTRERFDVELADVWAREAPTALLVTHSISEAIFLADRVIVLTERPASIARVIRIELQRPRAPSVLQLPEFHAYEREIRVALGMV